MDQTILYDHISFKGESVAKCLEHHWFEPWPILNFFVLLYYIGDNEKSFVCVSVLIASDPTLGSISTKWWTQILGRKISDELVLGKIV